jgi:hypothetical protein
MVTATTDDVEAKRSEIIAAMRNLADVPPVAGESKVGDEVHHGDSTLDTPMILSGVKSAGVVYIYDTRTGERSRTNRNMLPTQLMKKREDGSSVFTEYDPGITPVRGALKCMLHPDLRKDNPDYARWGLQTCPKANLSSPQEVKSHMRLRHKREWETIEDNRIEREKNEDRQLLRDQAVATQAALAAAVGNKQEPVTDGEPVVKKGPFGRPLKVTTI